MTKGAMGLVVLLGTALAACGDDDDGPADSGVATDGAVAADGPAAEPDAPVATPDAAAPDAPPPPDAMPPIDAAAPPTDGIVMIIEVTSGSENDTNADADFTAGPFFGAPIASLGDCQLVGEPSGATFSAGTISISGTTTPVTLTPAGEPPMVDYVAAPDPLPVDLFTEGATLSVSASGDDVPAFAGTVTAPAPVTFVGPTSISRSTPLPFTWTAAGADAMWVWVIAVIPMTENQLFLMCDAADSGSYTIPAEALQLIPAAYTTGVPALFRRNVTTVAAGSVSVELNAATARVGIPVALTP